MKYKVVWETYGIRDLEEKINEMICDGWRPLGGISVCAVNIGNNVISNIKKAYYQAMVLED